MVKEDVKDIISREDENAIALAIADYGTRIGMAKAELEDLKDTFSALIEASIKIKKERTNNAPKVKVEYPKEKLTPIYDPALRFEGYNSAYGKYYNQNIDQNIKREQKKAEDFSNIPDLKSSADEEARRILDDRFSKAKLDLVDLPDIDISNYEEKEPLVPEKYEEVGVPPIYEESPKDKASLVEEMETLRKLALMQALEIKEKEQEEIDEPNKVL